VAPCRQSPRPSISRGWEYLKRTGVPYSDIHINVRFPIRASNELLVSDIGNMERNFLISSQPLSAIKSAECFKRIKWAGLLRGTSEKTYEEQYTLSVAICAPAERNYCKSQSDDSGTVRNVIRAFLIRWERIY